MTNLKQFLSAAEDILFDSEGVRYSWGLQRLRSCCEIGNVRRHYAICCRHLFDSRSGFGLEILGLFFNWIRPSLCVFKCPRSPIGSLITLQACQHTVRTHCCTILNNFGDLCTTLLQLFTSKLRRQNLHSNLFCACYVPLCYVPILVHFLIFFFLQRNHFIKRILSSIF